MVSLHLCLHLPRIDHSRYGYTVNWHVIRMELLRNVNKKCVGFGKMIVL